MPWQPVLLAIDDDPAVQEIIRRTLSKEGYRVEQAFSGETGIARARQIRPDAITLDVMMPGMDGWAVLQQLKAHPETADIPVLMLTILSERRLGLSLGAADFLTKPFDRDGLIGALRPHIERACPPAATVIGDRQTDTHSVLEALAEQGWHVSAIYDPYEALQRIHERPPDLILLQLPLDGMSGCEFTQEIRSLGLAREIPIVVLTHDADLGPMPGMPDRPRAADTDGMIRMAFPALDVVPPIRPDVSTARDLAVR